MLTGVVFCLMPDLADVDPVSKQIGEGAFREWYAAANGAIGSPRDFRYDSPTAQILRQRGQRAEVQVAAEDDPHSLGFLRIDHELLVARLIAERHRPTHAHALLLRGGDLVANALARDLALELGERQQ